MGILNTEQKPNCIAMAFDSNMFFHAKRCIKTIQQYCKHPVDICVLALELKVDEIDWLQCHGARIKEDYSSLPRYENFPLYGYAQICRPYLRDLFPGYRTYMWVDADIRFNHPDAFDLYLYSTIKSPDTIVLCQEVDNNYVIVRSPHHAWSYHTMINQRISEIYGEDIERQMHYYYNFNTGIWAMNAESEIWDYFQQELSYAFRHEFNHMREQDALNVAIFKWGKTPEILPATMNWLCGLGVPHFDEATGRYVQPQYPFNPISVFHLIASNSVVEVNGEEISCYELYQRVGIA